MSVPQMVPANDFRKVTSRLERLETMIRELIGASGTLDSATIYKRGLTILSETNGGKMLLGDGSIFMWDDFADNPDGFGRIYTDPVEGANYSRWFPPHSAGDGLQNSVTMRGSAPGLPGQYWVYTDGIASIASIGATHVIANGVFVSSSGNVVLDAGDRVFVDAANSIDLVAPLLRLYGLPTTGAAPNLTLGYVGSDWTVATSVSSERYKTDVADIEVDVDDLLALTGITWVHNDSMDSSPEGPIGRNVGWSAERMDALPSLRQFVNYDGEGQPDSVEDARVAVAILELAKAQQVRLDAQAGQIAALTARLDALEASPLPPVSEAS